MKKYIFCVARGQEDQWEALCLDLDIIVEGNSFEVVQDRLMHAIVTYIEDAMKEAEPARSELLNRRAPLLVRLAWTWPFIAANIFGRNRDGDNPPLGFTAPCPA